MKVHAPRTLQLPASILTIGALDGVHLGHQDLIRQARESADTRGVPLVVYTFDPPPRVFFKRTPMLTTLAEKVDRLRQLGVDHVIVAPFDADYVSRGVQAFLEEIVATNPLEVWEGSDFRFGRNRDGDIHTLQERFCVRIVEPIRCEDGQIISSSRIRELLHLNHLKQAQALLGWPLTFANATYVASHKEDKHEPNLRRNS